MNEQMKEKQRDGIGGGGRETKKEKEEEYKEEQEVKDDEGRVETGEVWRTRMERREKKKEEME